MAGFLVKETRRQIMTEFDYRIRQLMLQDVRQI
jgi:hypothetical protein